MTSMPNIDTAAYTIIMVTTLAATHNTSSAIMSLTRLLFTGYPVLTANTNKAKTTRNIPTAKNGAVEETAKMSEKKPGTTVSKSPVIPELIALIFRMFDKVNIVVKFYDPKLLPAERPSVDITRQSVVILRQLDDVLYLICLSYFKNYLNHT
jgi:hypothetical protein